MRIGEFMTTRVEYVHEDITIYDAMKILADKNEGNIVLVNNFKLQDYFLVTARDIVSKVLVKGLDPKEIKISEIATKALVCLPPDAQFEEAALIMEKNNIGRIFVCERGKIVGLVSLLDVLSAELIMRARGIKSSDDHLTKETRSDFADRWQRIFQFITLKSISGI